MQHTHGYIHVSVFFFFLPEKAVLEEFDAQILQHLNNYTIDSVKKLMLKNLTALRKGIWRFQLHCRDCDFSYQECNINNYVCVRLWKSSAVLTGSVCCWRFVQSPWKLLDPKKFEKKEELHITLRIGNTLPTLQHIANTATHCQHCNTLPTLQTRTQKKNTVYTVS